MATELEAESSVEDRMFVIPRKSDEQLIGDPWGRGSAIKDKGFEPVPLDGKLLQIWAKDLGEQGVLRINYTAMSRVKVLPDGVGHEAFVTPTHYSIEMIDRTGHRIGMPRKFFSDYVQGELRDIFEAARRVNPDSME